jgi:hypothetical protein
MPGITSEQRRPSVSVKSRNVSECLNAESAATVHSGSIIGHIYVRSVLLEKNGDELTSTSFGKAREF